VRITPFVCSMQHAAGDAGKAIEGLAYQLDTKQWERAGIELGRIEELANRLAAVCRLAGDALADEAYRERAEKDEDIG
jgi:hypothetical protein